MPNVIASGTTVVNGTIKRNNFLIGVNTSVQYGPTSATTFWNGIVPAASGYTVYAQKTVNGPSIRTAANDAELITIAKQYGGTNITTIYDALNYFNGQSNFLVTNIDYPNIVTSGLTILLDAAYVPSYPTTGTTWNDLSANGLNAVPSGSFPTYSTGNGGNLVFNNNPLSLGSGSTLNLTNLTLSVWYKTTATSNQQLIAKNYTTSYYLNVAPAANSFSLWTNNTDLNSPTITTLGNGNWHNISATMVGTTKTLFYDGSQVSTGTGTIPAVDSFDLVIGSTGGNNPNPFSGSMGNVLIYNRALSATEITQNYNALKTRFGL